jgi:uncharacterized protein (TIGR00156 family)
MTRSLLIALLIAPFALQASDAFAGYSGPGVGAVVTTAAQARQQRDDQPVILRGTLAAKLGHERYRFTDASGDIEVEIDDDDIAGYRVGAGTVVELHGKVDTHRFKPTDVDVDHVAGMAPR